MRSCQSGDSCILNVADILESVVDGFGKFPFSEQYLVVQVHKRVLHVLLYFCDMVYVVNKEWQKVSGLCIPWQRMFFRTEFE